MNITFFKYVLEVERTSSISQAAENLFIAQPNLSKAIKDCEDSLGYKIFTRTPKGVVPTTKGRKFLEHAHIIVEQMDKIEGLAQNDDGETQRLSVCMPRGSYISKALVQFVASLDQKKGIRLNIFETGAMNTIANVASGEFSLGIVRYKTSYENYYRDYIEEKNLNSDLTWNFKYVVLMSKNHPLAHAETITIDDLVDSIEIVHGDTQVPYINIKSDHSNATGRSGPDKRIYLYERANQFELLSTIPETFMWVSLIPEDLLKRYDLIQRRCDFPGNNYKDVLIYRKDYQFTDLDKRFISNVFAVRNEVLTEDII